MPVPWKQGHTTVPSEETVIDNQVTADLERSQILTVAYRLTFCKLELGLKSALEQNPARASTQNRADLRQPVLVNSLTAVTTPLYHTLVRLER